MITTKTMAFKIIHSVAYFAFATSLLIICCNNDSGSNNPVNSNQNNNYTVTNSDLSGNWRLVKEVEDGETENFESTYFIRFNGNQMFSYENNGDCKSLDSSDYSLNENVIDSYLCDEGTKLSLSNNQLIMSVNNSDGSYTAYYTRYSGSMPPSNWPQKLCD